MMAKSIESLLKLVEERALSKKVEEGQQNSFVPYLPKECISNILIRLPIEYLPSSRVVCKPWYNIINSPLFVDAHLHRSESVLVFLNSVLRRRSHLSSKSVNQPDPPNIFSIETGILQSKPVLTLGQPSTRSTSKLFLQFIEFSEGKSKIGQFNVSCMGRIRAACNGLILLDNKLKRGGLMVMNPVTKKVILLPLGTVFPSHKESYGFAYSDVTGHYKVVHLFEDDLGYTNCEVLNLETRFWKEVNGPAFGLFGWLGNRPVSAIGALHWVPQGDHSDYIVSVEVDSEKFHKVDLPNSCRTYDRILEMDTSLCFVRHEELNIEIWILKDLHTEAWTKRHIITVGSVLDMVPLVSLKISGDLIFTRDEDHSFYVYDFKLQAMRKVEVEDRFLPTSNAYFTHVNSLVSWKRSQDMSE